MKWLFIIALLLNIIFFSSNTFLAEEISTNKPLVKASEQHQIVLLSELDEQQLKKLKEKIVISEHTDKRILNPQNTMIDSDEQSIDDNFTKLQAIEHTICYTIGPFSKQDLDEIKLILESEYKNNLSFGIETTSAITYYRIYIPPLENQAAITAALAKLDKNGMKDHYVMSIDGRKNAIALGVFKQRTAAERVAYNANKTGFSTTIEAISDDKNSQYKLLLVFRDDQDLSSYHDLMEQKNLKSTECEK